MRPFQTLLDTAGDILGTSQLAKLNKELFVPILRTKIKRDEYNQGLLNLMNISVQFHDLLQPVQEIEILEQISQAQNILNYMTDKGVIFKERRLEQFVERLSLCPGNNPLSQIVQRQLSKEKAYEFSKKIEDKRIIIKYTQ